MKKDYVGYFLLIVVFLLFCFKSGVGIDPDFGWHLKIGELIATQGIPSKDPFSYTMPSFPYVDHSWLSDVLLFHFYTVFGYRGLSVLFASLGTLSVGLLLWRSPKIGFLKLSLAVLAAAALISFMGVRIQVFSWLLFIGLLMVFSKEALYEKLKWAIPPYMLLWANMHGSFPFGLLLLGLFVLSKSLQEKKAYLEGIVILLVTLVASFANPYGAQLWREVLMTSQDYMLRFLIMEWFPGFISINFPYMVISVLGFIILGINIKSKSFFDFSVYITWFLLALSSVRYIPYFALAAAVISMKEISNLNLTSVHKKRLDILGKGLLAVVIIIGAFQAFASISSWGKNFSEDKYPVKAIAYLENNVEGKVFSTYGWGGYLIWKYPGDRVFIDGRMPSWRWSGAPGNESNNAMKDYYSLMRGNMDVTDVIERFEIEAFLLPKVSANSSWDNVLISLVQELYIGEFKKGLIDQLKEDGWKITYSDEIAVIYQKN